MSRIFQCPLGERSITLETGSLALQASGAVTVRSGDTIVLVTACVSPEPREGADFFPLTVDYEERHAAAGKIPGSFFRREGRPSQDAILSARLTDRSIRPLFPKGFYNDVQVVATVLSTDQEIEPDVLALVGASAALTLSIIPFEGPIGAVRVGYIGEKFVLNPTFSQLQNSPLEIVVASAKDKVVMLEAGAKEIPESLVLEAIKYGHEANQNIIRIQHELQAEYGKPKMEPKPVATSQEVVEAVSAILEGRLVGAIYKPRSEREQSFAALKEELEQKLSGRFSAEEIGSGFESHLKSELRKSILDKGMRIAGRGLTEIRSINSEVGLLPRTHGSALFTRGLTQVLTTTTLGSTGEEQMVDTIGQEVSKRFLHHYNFPPYASGETRRMGGPGRREVGHGALAERALTPILPDEKEFPYTIRLVSDVLTSNGSTSMASVCASSLALMDAGVPVKTHAAGVAMGLITEGERYVVLTDIEGLEDAYGDMDFKVAGTARGITAVQMDVKLKGISRQIVEEALSKAHDARLAILDKMNQTISSSRPELSKYAPRMYRITIKPDKIGAVIGPGGKMIRAITEETKATIDIEQDGTVWISSISEEAAQKAINMIKGLTQEVEVGGIYTGKVTRTVNFGAFVEILPGKEGLVHISELADYRVPSVEDVVKVGDEIMVMVTEIDRMGRINLSRRAVFQGQTKAQEAPQSPIPSRTEHTDRHRPSGPPPPESPPEQRDRRPRER